MTEWKEEVETKGDMHNTLKNFSNHFAEADRVRRRRLKLTMTAGNMGYHSANIVTDLETKINKKLNNGMAAVVMAANQMILQLMENHGNKTSAVKKPTAGKSMQPNDTTAALLLRPQACGARGRLPQPRGKCGQAPRGGSSCASGTVASAITDGA